MWTCSSILVQFGQFLCDEPFWWASDAGLDEQLIADLGYLNENEKNPGTQRKLHSIV
jgi:hypothetical protein